MESPSTLVSLVIIAGLVVVVAILFVLQAYVTGRYHLKDKLIGKTEKKPTYFLDEGEDGKKCEICYGAINDDPVAKCKCGKIFHDACAKPTGACPYCKAEYSTMEVRDPIRSRCPVCGRFMKGNVCECGAVLPRKDDTFLCTCGNRVDANRPVCKKCGAVYESVKMQIYKQK